MKKKKSKIKIKKIIGWKKFSFSALLNENIKLCLNISWLTDTCRPLPLKNYISRCRVILWGGSVSDRTDWSALYLSYLCSNTDIVGFCTSLLSLFFVSLSFGTGSHILLMTSPWDLQWCFVFRKPLTFITISSYWKRRSFSTTRGNGAGRHDSTMFQQQWNSEKHNNPRRSRRTKQCDYTAGNWLQKSFWWTYNTLHRRPVDFRVSDNIRCRRRKRFTCVCQVLQGKKFLVV